MREVGRRTRVPGWVPGAAHAFAGTPGFEDVHGAAHGYQGSLGFEHVKLVLAHREPHRPGTALAIHERPDDEYALKDLADAALQQGVLGSFRHDHLVGFAVDHELPPALMNVGAFLIFPDGQAPLLKQVHGGIHVPGDVGHQIFTGDAHEIVAHVIHIVLYACWRHPSDPRTG